MTALEDSVHQDASRPRSPQFTVIIPAEHGSKGAFQGPWEQVVEAPSENLRAVLKLYHVSWIGQASYALSSILTCGIVALWCSWFPVSWIHLFATRISQVDDSKFTSRADRRCDVSSFVTDEKKCHLSGALLAGRPGRVWAVVEDNCCDRPQLIPVQVQHCQVPMATVFQSHVERDDQDKTLSALVTIQYRSLRWIWNPSTHLFQSTCGWKDINWTKGPSSNAPEQAATAWTLSKTEVKHRQAIFEANSMVIPQRSTFSLLTHEVLTPFTVFQVFSCIVWSISEYKWYSFAIALITILSTYSTMKQARASTRRIHQMTRVQPCDIHVYREGWGVVESTELVPGDLVSLAGANISVLPCDMLMLSGEAVVDESTLTGQSLSVNKSAASHPSRFLADADLSIPIITPSRHILFAGTKLVRVTSNSDGQNPPSPPLALVIRTGFCTAKGSLIRSMLYQATRSTKHQDTIKYLRYMTVLGFLATVYTIKHFLAVGASRRIVILRALELLTILIPPALPAALTAGIACALARLRSQRIFCTSPNYLNAVGQCQIIVFDKTGTLTEYGLTVQDVILSDGSNAPPARFAPLLIEIGMATCHEVKVISEGKLFGDPLDVRMVEWTKWTLQNVPDYGVGLVARGPAHVSISAVPLVVYPFDANLRRMSVMTKVVETDDIRVFCKGAPEEILSLCDSTTVPKRIERTISDAGKRGLRVIAMASRLLTSPERANPDNVSRQQLEQNMQFLGLILFENAVKPHTAQAMQDLNNASIRCMMCTGDSVKTAISVAYKTGMIESHESVYVSRLAPPNSSKEIVWESANDPNMTLDNRTAQQMFGDAHVLAVTGEAFDYMLLPGNEHYLHQAFSCGVVFARMSPDQKQILVEKLQEQYGQHVGFVGDGANDVGALRAANFGLSLSNTDASIAAPFTSAECNGASAVALLKEGRAALATSFSCFKFMAIYSWIQIDTIALLYSIKTSLSESQLLYIDLIVILPLALTLARSSAAKTLAEKPPSSSLFSKGNMFTIVGAAVLQFFIQRFMFNAVRMQPFYSALSVDAEKNMFRCFEGTVLFFLSCFIYLATSLSFAPGKPHRSGPTPLFVGSLTAILAATILLAKSANPRIMTLFELVPIPPSFLSRILSAVGVFALVIFILETLSQFALAPAPCCQPCGQHRRAKEIRQRRW